MKTKEKSVPMVGHQHGQKKSGKLFVYAHILTPSMYYVKGAFNLG